MRVFAAVLPPDDAVRELSAAVRGLRELPGAERLRWTEPAAWHVTLAFYGETADELLPGLRAGLAHVAARHRPFTLRLADGGRFGDQVLWADLAGDRAPLSRLAADAAEAGRQAGVVREDDPWAFQPHLTLARARRRDGVALGPYARALTGFEGGQWQSARLALVSSHPPAGDPDAAGRHPRYVTETLWPLTG